LGLAFASGLNVPFWLFKVELYCNLGEAANEPPKGSGNFPRDRNVEF
jgi:hypothetical protein